MIALILAVLSTWQGLHRVVGSSFYQRHGIIRSLHGIIRSLPRQQHWLVGSSFHHYIGRLGLRFINGIGWLDLRWLVLRIINSIGCLDLCW